MQRFAMHWSFLLCRDVCWVMLRCKQTFTMADIIKVSSFSVSRDSRLLSGVSHCCDFLDDCCRFQMLALSVGVQESEVSWSALYWE